MGAPAVLDYDPRAVILIVGARIMQGFADGTMMALKRNQPVWSYVTGAYGAVTRVKNSNRSWTLTLTMDQSHDDNQYLSLIMTDDEMNGKRTFSVLIRDGSGATLGFAPQAFLEGYPEIGYATTNGTRAWSIIIPSMQVLVGANKEFMET